MRVGFIGLGTMGGPMALNVRKAGHELVVHDKRLEAGKPHVAAGARWADGIAELARDAEVVFTSLPRPADVEKVAAELLQHMGKGGAWFDLTTSSPALIRRLQPAFEKQGIALLDAPVSGGPRGAKSGQLAIWVGGDRAAFDRYLPLLNAIGDQVLYIGPVGTGLVAKLVNNCAHYAIQTAVAEIFTLGVRGGVDPLTLWSALRQGSSGRMRTFDRLGRHFLQGVFDPPDFALGLAHKDVTLSLELARELDVPMRVAGLTHAEMTEALRRGWGERDSRVAMLLQEERAGVDIKVSAADIKNVMDRDP
jgi:3-hydroxyisobutyrate dehydrogenase